MRWGVPWFMLVFAVVTLMMQGQGLIYTLALVAQVAFYMVALSGWLFTRLQQSSVVRIIFFFVQTNLALAHAVIAFMLGKRITVWKPSER